MSNIGYIRVSSVGQNTERQLVSLELDKVFEDKCSAKTIDRPQLKICLEWLRDGDMLHVHSIDRLARELLQQWRKNWALECSRMLRHIGLELEADRWEYGHLTLKEQYKKAIARNDLDYAEQACNHEPTKHKGVHIHQMERRGIESYVLQDRKQIEASIHGRNEKIVELETLYQELEKERHILEILDARNKKREYERKFKVGRTRER